MTNPQRVMDWYNHNAALEHDRLNACRLEFSISMRIWEEAPADMSICQAVELARNGQSVTLVDISQSELDMAKSFATESGVTIDAIVRADARAIQLHPDKDDPKAPRHHMI
ncbi:uncharacterized protein N7529_001887 [Penicillium soppii]|uniref:uncharacterized protein n=1 Tax=Penicillium soppii TaxID=69789 RepID=UPI002548A176|nr:uncharacterized protein N7529_001887 [Penicillium soppii]KAJ5876303.1 hypothetical protein N7529_001887 [Penicillium soppii]